MKSFNLKGNNFSSINECTQFHLPNLQVLNLAENNFSCQYLIRFLLNWNNLEVEFDSDQTHFDCLQKNLTIYEIFKMNNLTFVINNLENNSHNHLDTFQPRQFFIVFIAFTIFVGIIVLLTKSKCIIKNVRHKRNNVEQCVIYDKYSS